MGVDVVVDIAEDAAEWIHKSAKNMWEAIKDFASCIGKLFKLDDGFCELLGFSEFCDCENSKIDAAKILQGEIDILCVGDGILKIHETVSRKNEKSGSKAFKNGAQFKSK